MIATIQVLENGSYSPNRVLPLGNKYDNLDNAYIVFRVPDRYLNYFFYVYAVNGKHKYTFPLNWVTEENSSTLRFYITSTLTQWAGTWQLALIAAEGELNNVGATLQSLLNNNILTSEVFVSNVILGTVADNHITNPLTSDLEDNNLEIMYNQLRELAQNLENAYDEGNLDGPYFIPHVSETGIITWTGTKPDMPIPASRNIMGPMGPQGERPIIDEEVDVQVVEEHATATITGQGTPEVPYKLSLELPKVGSIELEQAVENVLARMFVWDEETQTLTINVNLIGE